MATGDISVTIRPDGWSADVAIEGFVAGATFNFGLTGNNVPSASTPYFTVVSKGFDATGAATTITRTVYMVPRGTNSVVRCPYSTSTQAGGTWSGTFVDGETITCSTSLATAIVVGNQSSGAVLRYRNLTGTPLNTQTWTGGTSGATFVNTTNTVTTLTQPTNDELVTATGIVVRVALSDYIFQKDNTGGGNSGTAPTVTIPAAWATNTGGASQTSNALSGAAVTQNSTAAYQPPVANWSRPPFQRATGNFNLGVVAFHGTSAVNAGTQAFAGKHNIACVIFTAADTHSHTATTTVTAPSIDSSQGDAVPVLEHVATMDVSTLTALDLLTCNFTAYPVVGDVTLTSVGGASQPSPLVGPITWLNDKSSTYGITVAYVAAGGSDAGANTVYDIGSYPGDGSAYKFASIGKAANAIKAYNAARSPAHNDVGGGIIYLGDGSWNYTGSSNSNGSTNDTWLTIQRSATSTSRAAVDIANPAQTGDKAIASKLRLYDITISSSISITFQTQPYIWFDYCTITGTGTALVYSTSQKYITRCTTTAGSNGLYRPYSTDNAPPAIIRGNTISGLTSQDIYCYTILGNLATGIGSAVVDELASQTMPAANNNIFAFNKFLGLTNASNPINLRKTVSMTGLAFVQNVLEYKSKTSATLTAIADGTGTPFNNIILWNNTVVGQRSNIAYNDTGSTSCVRLYWSIKNNVFYDYNVKTDTFTTANGNRIGNWPVVYEVGSSGNLVSDSGNGFLPDFTGLKSVAGAWTSPDPEGYFLYTSYLAYDGTGADGTAGAGGGTYTLTATAPAIGMQNELVLPYDLSGTARAATDAAGAYHYGTAGLGFWLF